jgi:holo-[acyl-carrier protein] synthase
VELVLNIFRGERMIIGTGVDIIEIDRIKRAAERTKSFMSKVYSENEIVLFREKGMRMESVAGNFAAKEAISKALGTGIRGFQLKDIEIVRNGIGKPEVYLYGRAKIIAELKGVKSIHISISHSKNDAIAFAVLEG